MSGSLTNAANLKASKIGPLLKQRIAFLTGGRDHHGRAIISFPARENAEKTTAEEYRFILDYFYAIPSDEVKELGFVAIFDMRHGLSWNAVKPALKVLQECFPGAICGVYILKPDKFWEKHKASISSGKYKFEVKNCFCLIDFSF